MNRIVHAVPLRHTSAQHWKPALRWVAHAVLVIGLVWIAGCSRGGSSNPDPVEKVETPTPTPTPIPTPTPTPTPIPLVVKPLTVNPEVVSKNVVSNASHLTPQIVFTNLGTGIAAWSVSTGSGYRALYSVYDAAIKTWSPEETLAISDLSDPQPRVISNGETLLLVWSQDENLYGRIYTPNTPQAWSDARQLNDATPGSWAQPESIGIATDGQTYLVTWQGINVYARMFASNAWSPQPELIGPTDNASGFHPVIGRGTHNASGSANGYIATWIEFGDGKIVTRDTTRVRANMYHNNTGAWSGPLTVAIEPSHLDSVQIASNDIGHALYWTHRSTGTTSRWSAQARVSVFDTRSLPATWSAPLTLSTTTENLLSIFGTSNSIAASRTEFAAVWVEQDATNAVVNLLSSHYSMDGTGSIAWRTVLPLATTEFPNKGLQIVGSDNGFACAWANNSSVVRALYSGGAWAINTSLTSTQSQYFSWFNLATHANEYALAYTLESTSTGVRAEQMFATETSGTQWSAPVAVLPVGQRVTHANAWRALPTIAGSPSGFWYAAPQRAADATDHISNVVIRRPGAAPTDTVEKLALNRYRGSADTPLLASNSSGDLLTAWPQYNDGDNDLYAAVRHNGVWSEATRLNLPDPNPYFGGVDAGSIRVAANGNTFAVLWNAGSGVNLRTYDASNPASAQWDALPYRADGNKSNVYTLGAALTTYKTGYALSWIQHASSAFGNVRSVELATLLNGAWQQISAEAFATENRYGAERSQVAEGKDHALLVAWSTANTPESTSLTTRLWKDGTWSNPSVVSTTLSNGVYRLTLQSTASGSFALYWQSYNNPLFAALFPLDATAWTTPQALTSRGDAFASVAGASRHVAAWLSSGALEATQALSNEWQPLVSVKKSWRAGNNYMTQPRMIELGDTVLYAWNATDYQHNTVGLGKLVGDTWAEVFAIGDFGIGPIQRRDPSLARFGDGAAMAWVQYDRSTDASLAEIVVQPALF